jgi:o-succinylbenzoate---CoA ligase
MDKKLSTYQINDQSYSFHELMDYCQIQSENNVGWQADNCRFIKEWLSDDDFIRTHTSGSTGEPKMIEMQKSRVEASARLTASYFELRPGTKVLLCLPATYIAGKMVIARALVNGWHLKWTEPSSPRLRRCR